MTTLRIGAVSERTGVPASTLRYWEEQGVIEPASRVGGQRRYEPGIVARVARILALQAAGCTLAEVAALLGEPGDPAWREVALRKLPRLLELQQRVARLVGELEGGLREPSPENGKGTPRSAGSWRSW